MNAQLEFAEKAHHFADLYVIPKEQIQFQVAAANQDMVDVPAIEISADEISVRRLISASDVQLVQHLRHEINLDLHRARDPLFAIHEKKEMS